MKKKEAVTILMKKIIEREINPEKIFDCETVESQIRTLADKDECFENVVFELGCHEMTKKFCKVNGLAI